MFSTNSTDVKGTFMKNNTKTLCIYDPRLHPRAFVVDVFIDRLRRVPPRSRLFPRGQRRAANQRATFT